MGTICKVFDILKNTAMSKEFPKQVLKDDCWEELHSKLCGNAKKIQRS